jgi:hypothetical protein
MFSWCSPLLFLLTSILLQGNQRGQLLDVTGLKPTNCWLLESDAYMYGYVMPVVLMFIGIFVHLVKIYIVVRYTVSMQVSCGLRRMVFWGQNIVFRTSSKNFFFL